MTVLQANLFILPFLAATDDSSRPFSMNGTCGLLLDSEQWIHLLSDGAKLQLTKLSFNQTQFVPFLMLLF